ncbi:MAG TPA: MopE-related protein, partial [Myxococcota bacterium]|nr:MopE-related protein [Myxococcota bacterium]
AIGGQQPTVAGAGGASYKQDRCVVASGAALTPHGWAWSGAAWVEDTTFVSGGHGEAAQQDATETFELRVSREWLGDPLTLDLNGYWVYSAPGAEVTFGGTPAGAFTTGSTDPDLAAWWTFRFAHPSAPSTYTPSPDGGAPDIAGQLDWWPDRDDDGQGVHTDSIHVCAMHVPTSFADPAAPDRLYVGDEALAVDCDDTNPAIYVGAPDPTGDGIDQDCDGGDGHVNDAPRATSCHISPASPRSSQDLTASASGTDTEGDPITWTYAWYVNGALDGTVTGSTYAASRTDRGDVIHVVCRPYDGFAYGATATSSDVTVANGLPTATQCTLTPIGPTSTVDLSVTAAGSDPDGDPVTFTYTWRVNGAPDASVTGTTYPASRTDRGEAISVTCVPNDGVENGSGLTSAAQTILNAPPTFTNVTLQPLAPADISEAAPPQCVVNGVTDPDGDTVSRSYTWLVNGVVVAGQTGSALSASSFARGDTVQCTATLSDGHGGGAGPASSDVRTVGNAPPTAPGVVITRTGAGGASGDAVCSVVTPSTDPDGDAVSYTVGWSRNGEAWTGTTGTATLAGDTILKDDIEDGTFTCSIVPDDGAAFGPPGTDTTFLVAGLAPVQLRAGTDSACVITDDGYVRCWGRNQSGQLGVGSTASIGDGASEMGNALGRVGYGNTEFFQQIALGEGHACGLLDNGKIRCWGRNTNGEVGAGHANNVGDSSGEINNASLNPIIDLGVSVVQVDAGKDFSCARRSDGVVQCWGRNAAGSLGIGSTVDRGDNAGEMAALAPVALGAGRTAKDIAAGRDHVCALLDDGAVKCWGGNSYGQLGQGTTLTRGDGGGEMGDALAVTDLGPGEILDLEAGDYHTCALFASGQVKCWGRNASGQLGLGDTTSRGNTPSTMGTSLPFVDLGTGRVASRVTAGADHSCALLDDGSVKCWGIAVALGYGNGTNLGDAPGEMGDALPAVSFNAGISVDQIDAGKNTTCIVTPCGAAYCWGENTYGQLGRGNTSTLFSPPASALALPTNRFVATPAAQVCHPNSPPTATTCTINPSSPITTNTLSAGVAASDPDGHYVSWSYTWTVNGVVDASATGSTYPASSTDRWEEIGLTCTPSDRRGPGAALQATPVVIANALPTASACSIAPGVPTGDEDVTATSAGSDIDADPIVWVYAWKVNGVVDPAQTGPVYPFQSTTPGDLLQVECYPTDGYGTGSGRASNSVRVNTPPVLSGCDILPAAPESDDALSAVAPATDADGHPIVIRYVWTKNGAVDASETGSTYPAAKTTRDDVISVDCTPEDPYEVGAGMSSSDVLVGNTPPYAPQVRINRSGSLDAPDLTCVMLTPSTDDDGDPITYALAWTKNGAPYAGASTTTTMPGDTLLGVGFGTYVCTITPSDPAGPGPAGRAARVIAPGGGPNLADTLDGTMCAILDGGQVTCVGENGNGQLGVGSTENIGDHRFEMGDALARVNLGAGRTATEVAVGTNHACALLDDQTVRCWGANANGQLGIGNTTQIGDQANEVGNPAVNPVVNLGTGALAAQIGAGEDFTCARLTDGRVKCWGYGLDGRLGRGNVTTYGDSAAELGDSLLAVDLGPGNIATDLAVGNNHACVLLQSGEIKCWGDGADGKLGYGNVNDRGDGAGELGSSMPPVDLGVGITALDVEAGPQHTCAVLNTGALKCWGYNANGQLGLGNTASRGDGPSEMGNSLPVVDLGTGRTALVVRASRHHTCAGLDDGTMKCWGQANFIGHGSTTVHRGDGANEMGNNLPIVPVPGNPEIEAIVAGGDVSCAITSCGESYCWGSNLYGSLGQGNTTELNASPSLPMDWGTWRYVNTEGAQTCNLNQRPSRPVTRIDRAGTETSFALVCSERTPAVDPDGDALSYTITWARNGAPWAGPVETTALPGDTIPASSVDTAIWTCTITPRDAVGAGPADSESHLVAPARESNRIDGTEAHYCVVLEDGSVRCLGYNGYGNLGHGDTLPWGNNPGDLGDNFPATFLGAGRTAIEIAVGQYHTCALMDDHNIRCWGDNTYGELGQGAAQQTGDAPGEMANANNNTVDLGTGVVADAVLTGNRYSCAITTAGRVKCWGYSSDERLGVSPQQDRGRSAAGMGDALQYVDLGANRTVLDLALGGAHACALLDDGAVKCWGYNAYGQLGQGNTTDRGVTLRDMGDFLDPVDLGGGVVVEVEAGLYHSCARFSDGRMKCWGHNSYGQLGLGNSAHRGDGANEMGATLAYVDLGTNRRAVSMSTGEYHTCAALDDGTVKCWGAAPGLGYANNQQRGDQANEMGDNLPAVGLPVGVTFDRVIAGNDSSCAVTACGETWCWGTNTYGQLGVGVVAASVLTPSSPINLGTSHYVATSSAQSCNVNRRPSAPVIDITRSGSPDAYDLLCSVVTPSVDPDGDTFTYAVSWSFEGAAWTGPTATGALAGDTIPAASVSVGRWTCSVTASDAGGAGPAGVDRYVPYDPAVDVVDTWGTHTCVVLEDGSVRCLGYNGYGQLGIGNSLSWGNNPGDLGDNLPPVNLGADRTAVEIATGWYHTCALLDDGNVRCWGRNDYGELGLSRAGQIGDAANEVGDPTLDPTVNVGSGRTVLKVDAGAYYTCAVLDDGGVKCWGYSSDERLGAPPQSNRGLSAPNMGDNLPYSELGQRVKAIDVTVGEAHACALLDSGDVKCWGYNNYGQLGYEDVTNRGTHDREMGDWLRPVNLGGGTVV